MTRAVLLIWLLPAVALAEPSELVRRYTVSAIDAARAGNCDISASIGERVKAQDPDYHAQVFVRDAAIAACMSGTPLPQLPPPAIRVAQPTPPLRGCRVAAELLVGGVLGATGFFLGTGIGHSAGRPDPNGSSDEANWSYIFAGGAIGATIGVPIGVWLIGNSKGEQGSFLASMAGTAVGAGLGAAALWYGGDDGLAVFAAIALPVAGGILGFNLTRHAREPAVGSLFVVRNGSFSLGVPVVRRANAATHLSLLSGSF